MASTNLPGVVGPRRLAQALTANAELRLLDVRTAGEFERSHIAGSYNVPLDRLEAHAKALAAVRAPIVLVCRSGARARTAEELLRRAGARRLHVLDGGLLAWRDHGLAVDGKPMSLGAVVRRVAGAAGIVLAALTARENPLLGVMLAFVGVRLVFGQSVLPCAAAGTCAVPGMETRAVVDALVEGRPADGSAAGDGAPSPWGALKESPEQAC